MHPHVFHFAGLSTVVAVFGSWTALDLSRRVQRHVGPARTAWLSAAALAMGASIWSMHFIAMLGFDPGTPVRYDPALTAASLALAVGATAGAFFASSREAAPKAMLVASGAAMGLGICLMHYVGMAAVRSAVSFGYDPRWVAASVLVAVGASTAALFFARRERSAGQRALAAGVLGLAVVAMHYTGMAGLRIEEAAGVGGAGAGAELAGAPPFIIAAAVAAGTTGVLALALLASFYDQRVNILSALDAGQVGYWELSLPEFRLQVSPGAKALFGRQPMEPFGYSDFLDQLGGGERKSQQAVLEHLMRKTSDWDREYRLEGSGRWINVRGRLKRDPAGRPRRMTGVVLDVTDRRAASEAIEASELRQRLLILELNHRVKNTLAIVQSMAAQTLKRSARPEEFAATFEGRLLSLSRTHDALTQGSWESADLGGLLQEELRPYAEEQLRVSGPAVALSPREALALGMTFHELATNAAKYGALSTPEGCLTVQWEDNGAELTARWSETGGPEVSGARSLGFGSRLIDASIRRQLQGEVRLDWRPSGLFVELRFPREGEDGPESVF